jgi:hypothetical protein
MHIKLLLQHLHSLYLDQIVIPNTYIYITISYAFLQEELPHRYFLFSRCFQSYVQQSQHSHQLLR